jgi:hypothetical protein
MSKERDLKSPDQMPAKVDRGKQVETPSRQYVDLATGQICVDGFEPLPNAATEDPNLRIVTKRLSNTSAKPLVIGSVK